MDIKRNKINILRYMSDIALGSAIQNPIKDEVYCEVRELLHDEEFSMLNKYLYRKKQILKSGNKQKLMTTIKEQITKFVNAVENIEEKVLSEYGVQIYDA